MTSPSAKSPLITTTRELEEVLSHIAAGQTVAIDTEANGLHGYPDKICLIQLATTSEVYLIDPIAVKDMTPLGRLLSDSSIEKVIHAADNEVRWFHRDWGLLTRNVYDTTVAARFVGLTHIGLGSLLEEVLGLRIEKSASIQKSDWARRPLNKQALEYAAGDVQHLLALRDAFDRQLATLGRSAWVAEECLRLEGLRYTKPDPSTAFLAVKGAARLNRREQTVFKSLYDFREAAAISIHRPPFFIISNEVLLFLAAHPATPLEEVPDLRKDTLIRHKRPLERALRDGLNAPLLEKDPAPKYQPYTSSQLETFAALRKWRAGEATRLSLDPFLVWPTISLERLAREPFAIDRELVSSEVRQWQRHEFGASLRTVISPPLPAS